MISKHINAARKKSYDTGWRKKLNSPFLIALIGAISVVLAAAIAPTAVINLHPRANSTANERVVAAGSDGPHDKVE